MIRLILALVIVALLLMKLSEMFGAADSASPEPTSPEDTMIGAAYEPYTRAKKFGEKDYQEALDKQREEMDKKIDGG